MIPAPLRFLEVKQELGLVDAAKLHHAGFGIGPEALDAVDVLGRPRANSFFWWWIR